MSVWTSYRFDSEEGNVAELLKKAGVMDDNHKLDLSKAYPEWWEEDFAHIKKRGVIYCSNQIPSLDNILMHNHIPDTRNAPEIKDAIAKGYVLSHFCVRNNRYGAYMYTDKKHSTKKIFVPLSKENSDKAIAYAESICNMYSPCSDEHGYRRDYTDYELSLITPLVPMYIDKDGLLGYSANYATHFNDDMVLYISKALPTTKIHLVQTTEGKLDFNGYFLNGKRVYNNAWISGVSPKLVRERTTNGRKSYSVSINVGRDATGAVSPWITIIVNPGQVMKSDKSQYLSIMLGDMDETRKALVKSAHCIELTLSNADIAKAYSAQRKAYNDKMHEHI